MLEVNLHLMTYFDRLNQLHIISILESGKKKLEILNSSTPNKLSIHKLNTLEHPSVDIEKKLLNFHFHNRVKL
jgi:hypothetical protein